MLQEQLLKKVSYPGGGSAYIHASKSVAELVDDAGR